MMIVIHATNASTHSEEYKVQMVQKKHYICVYIREVIIARRAATNFIFLRITRCSFSRDGFSTKIAHLDLRAFITLTVDNNITEGLFLI